MFHMCTVLRRHRAWSPGPWAPQPGSLTAPCRLSHHNSPPGTEKRMWARAHLSPQVTSTSHTWSTAIGATRQPSESTTVRQMRALHANGTRGESRHDTYCVKMALYSKTGVLGMNWLTDQWNTDTYCVKTGLIFQYCGSGHELANRPTYHNRHSNTVTCVRSKTCKCGVSYFKPPRKRQPFFFSQNLPRSY